MNKCFVKVDVFHNSSWARGPVEFNLCKLFHWLILTDNWRQCLYHCLITGWGEKHLRITMKRSFSQRRL